MAGLGSGELALLARYLYQTRGAFVGRHDTLDTGSQLDLHLLQAHLDFHYPLTEGLRLDARAKFDAQFARRSFQAIPVSAPSSYQAGDVNLIDGLTETEDTQAMILGLDVKAAANLGESNLLVGGITFRYLGMTRMDLARSAGSVGCQEGTSLLIRGYHLGCGETEGAAAGKDRMTFGFFAQDQWQDVLAGLDLTAAIRLDYLTDVGLAIAPQGAVIYRPLEGLWLKLLYARAYRAPTFHEMYEDSVFYPMQGVTGSDSLKPVMNQTIELVVHGRIPARPVEFHLQASVWHAWIRDGIAPDPSQELRAQYANIESIDILGAEAELSATFGRRNRLFANGAFFRAEVAGHGDYSQSFITDVPQMRFNLGLDLAMFEWLDLHLMLQHGSERRSNTRRYLEVLRPFRIPAYTLVRIGFTTEPVLYGLSFFAHAINVFDQDMRDPAPRPDRLPGNLPRMPFSFMFGAGWQY
jgi:outer membrane receptor protein involved in Fe transport